MPHTDQSFSDYITNNPNAGNVISYVGSGASMAISGYQIVMSTNPTGLAPGSAFSGGLLLGHTIATDQHRDELGAFKNWVHDGSMFILETVQVTNTDYDWSLEKNRWVRRGTPTVQTYYNEYYRKIK